MAFPSEAKIGEGIEERIALQGQICRNIRVINHG